MPRPEIPSRKSLLYELCDFLVRFRLTDKGDGINNPIDIPLKDFRAIARPEQINELGKKLKLLASERVGLGYLFEVSNPKIFSNFKRNFSRNKILHVRYSRTDIEKYKNSIVCGDQIAASGPVDDKIHIKPEANRNFLEIFYQGESVKFHKNDTTKSIQLNICLLMFKFPVCYINNLPGGGTESPDISSVYPDYEIGNNVEADVLVNLILIRDEDEDDVELPRGDRCRPIRDAIRNINKETMRKFDTKLFTYHSQAICVYERIKNKIKIDRPLV